MRFAILSDTHFGDDSSQLVNAVAGTPELTPRYDAFKELIGRDNDFLVLSGDILDFSIAPYEKAYRCAQVFFQEVLKDGLARQIIYIPGNHDADIWHMVQHQRSVILKLADGELPVTYEHAVAGVLDDRTGIGGGLTLRGVSVNKSAGKSRYGGLFLDRITNPPITFNFAYPNLYVVTDTETVLVTHGQYLEPFWSILSEISVKIAKDDLDLPEMNMESMVEMNYPFNQLACTGTGQAGVLTEKVIRPVMYTVKDRNTRKIEKYLDGLEKQIDDLTDFKWIVEWYVDFNTGLLKKHLLKTLTQMKNPRVDNMSLGDKKVHERFERYFHAMLCELKGINASVPANGVAAAIPTPAKIIFGHTHRPRGLKDPDPKKEYLFPKDNPITFLYNTGGWLQEGGVFNGAEVFLYETGKGFSSQRIL
jgi:UDP-2,3-diacylglucosamine pyrophosphatase LpxH